MNFNFLPNSVRPNLPLRKPSSSPMVRAPLPSSGQALPARPTSNIQGLGLFQSPSTPVDSPASRSQITPPVQMSSPSVYFCTFCGKQGNLRCKRCKKTPYCSAVCQTEDWKAHRHMCKAVEAESPIVKPLENSASPVSGDKPGSLENLDTTSIQRVYLKDLHLKDITGTEIQAAIVEFQSPGRFFVVSQSADVLEALQIIAVELQKTYGLPTASAHKPVVDEVCAVQYSCDMNWYRGLILQLDADQAHVLYIDFGNEEKVPFERIRPLTAKLQQYAPCAIECCISGVVPAANVWSGKCRIAVWQLLEGKILTVKVSGTLDNSRVHAVDIVLSKGNTLSSVLLEHEYAEKETTNKTLSEQDINAMVNASMENFKCLSVGKDDNLWAQVPEPLTQAVGDTFPVVVTHIQSPERIVVQKVDNAGVIQDLQMKLREHCSQVPASTNFRPAPGTVCCALFSEDKQWYRAKVLAYSSEERVCVGYLDFGNSEDVDLNSLRPITQSLLATPMQAMVCGLAGVKPVGESWSQECLQALQRRISHRILRIELQGAQEGNVLVTLIDEASDPQASIAELLIFAGFAAPVVDESNDIQPLETPVPAPEVPDKVSSPPPEPLVWSCVELSPEEQTVLRVCCVESPGRFFCHIVNPTDCQRLVELEAELKSHCEVETSAFDPKLGEPCCAIIAETGGKCFRALIKQLCEDEVLATLADYGHSLTVKKSHLRPITSRFLALPFQALPCWLAGVVPEGSEWTAEALLWFQTQIEGEALSARVLSVTDDGYGVELQRKGQSVAGALVAEHLAIFLGEGGKQEAASVSSSKQNENVTESSQGQTRSPPQLEQTPNDAAPCQMEAASYPMDWKTTVLPVNNESFEPCIAAVTNPSLFYVFGPRQVEEEQIRAMMLQLAEYCNARVSQSPEEKSGKPMAGVACCARFTADNTWYRAVVLEVCDQEVSVIYADYGNSEKVSLSSILPIPARFLQLPFQITRCSVVGKELIPKEWPREVLQMFLGALQHGVVATVQSFDGFSNILSLSVRAENGGVQVNTMIVGTLEAHSQSTAGPASDQIQIQEPLVNSESVAEANTESNSEPSPSSEMALRVKDGTTTPEDRPPVAPQTPKLGQYTEAAQVDPVQRILEHMEPLCTNDAKTRDSDPNDKNEWDFYLKHWSMRLWLQIDQLEQLIQAQISLIKKLIAQSK